MKILDIGGIPTSLGEIINFKHHLDIVRPKYDAILLNFQTSNWKTCLHTEAPDWNQKKILWDQYLEEIGKLFFGEPPYLLGRASNKWGGDIQLTLKKLGVPPQKAEMGHLLCKGTSLNLGEAYIVITTKIRYIKKTFFYPHSIELWNVLRKLSTKYKIVILGEREVEMRKEYLSSRDSIFGIYDQIIANLPADRLVDLTVPALGETVTNLEQIQQDCLIMKEAKFVITLGVGGNFCMATSVSNMALGFRNDNLSFTDAIFNKEYPNAIITKDWAYFIKKLESYL